MAPRFVAGVLVLLAVVGVLTTALRKPTVKKTIEPNVTIIARDFHDSGPIAIRRVPVTNATSSPKHKARRMSRPRPKIRPTVQAVSPKPQKRPLSPRKPKTVKTKPDRRRPHQRPQQSQQTGQNQSPPPQQPKPPVCVRAPVPVTLSTPVAGVNSC